MAGEGEEDEEEGPSSRPSQYPPMLLSAADCRSSTVTANPTNDLDLEVCEESRAGFMREFSTTIGRTTKQVDQAQDCLK